MSTKPSNADGSAPKGGAVPASNPFQELANKLIAEKFPEGAGIYASGIVTSSKIESFVSRKGESPVTWESQKITVSDGEDVFTMNQMRNATAGDPALVPVPMGACIKVKVTSTRTEKGAPTEVRGELRYV